ncbi:MAG: CNNM domain-containing protein, partial [Pseudomonadota bacterium]|nr:CNNM domain-containing protein [Pseudomonadota bacterium]
MFWISSGIIFCLLCLSGFFSGSETSLTAVSEARMLSMEKDGNKRATLVRKLTERKERLIGALLLGNNLVNILATSLATGVLMAIFGEAGIVYATLFMTLLVLIFAEVLPKTYALMNADRMALFISPIINVVVI